MIKDINIPKVIVICGPTCSGKTKFAIEIASQLNGEIVNADSMQIYRYMNIGTAKPTIYEQAKVYHHMLDVIYPNENFDVVKYSELAHASIKNILKKGRNVFIVGGSGFYIKVLKQGLFNIKTTDQAVRNNLRQQANKHGTKWLHKKLEKIDKLSAKKINENDVFRIIRALEVFKITNKTMTDLQKSQNKVPCPYEVLSIGLKWSREDLYQRINKRVDIMIELGFIEEVKRLLDIGYSLDLKSMQSLGYRHIGYFLNKIYSLNETINILKRDHRRYAKRQLTWFNADPNIHWLSNNKTTEGIELIYKFLL